MLESTEEFVTSALKRARSTLQKQLPSEEPERAPAPHSPGERELVERFTVAFEASDVDGIVALLTEDVRFAMPPLPFLWLGRDLAARFIRAIMVSQDLQPRLVATRASGQPAFCLYVLDPRTASTTRWASWFSPWLAVASVRSPVSRQAWWPALGSIRHWPPGRSIEVEPRPVGLSASPTCWIVVGDGRGDRLRAGTDVALQRAQVPCRLNRPGLCGDPTGWICAADDGLAPTMVVEAVDPPEQVPLRGVTGRRWAWPERRAGFVPTLLSSPRIVRRGGVRTFCRCAALLELTSYPPPSPADHPGNPPTGTSGDPKESAAVLATSDGAVLVGD